MSQARSTGQLSDKLARAWQVRTAHFPADITWSYPLDTAVLSLTGDHCALDCAHCGGHYLGGMRPIWDADPDTSTSCLVSGGCDPTGRVPVTAHLDRVRAWREGRTMNWHVGFVTEPEMARSPSHLRDLWGFAVCATLGARLRRRSGRAGQGRPRSVEEPCRP